MKILILLAFIYGCSSTSEIKRETVQISIKHYRQNDSWRVTYKLPRPVKALYFERQTNTFRKKNWKIDTPNIEIINIKGKEYIVSTDHKPFDKFRIEHKSFYEDTPKDYEFFFKYADGDVLMYTGHYDVHLLPDDFNEATGVVKHPDFKPRSKFLFTPGPSENLVILGKVYDHSIVGWTDDIGMGTYVYWGQAKPIETPHLTVVVDRAIPPWIYQAVKTNLPVLFDYYKNKLGYSLNFKPVVFLNHNNPKKIGLSNSGGTLPGLIQLRLSGKDWLMKNAEAYEYLFKFIAHEAAHLWNSQLFKYRKGKHSWMHEGSADAFAYRAMRDLKVISKDRYLEYLNSSLQKCILSMNPEYPLINAGRNRNFSAYYHCGASIGLLTELSIRSKDLFDFWKNLFKKAEVSNNYYSPRLYFENYKELLGDRNVEKEMQKLIYNSVENYGDLLESAFQKMRIKTQEVPRRNVTLANQVARKLISKLYRNDCGNHLNITNRSEYYLAHGSRRCQSFRKDFKFKFVEEIDIFLNPVKAYEIARVSCLQSKDVVLRDINFKRLTVQCSNLPGPYNLFEIEL